MLPILFLLGACVEAEPVALVAASAWTLAEASEDPLPDHRETEVPCDPYGVTEDAGGIEIDTQVCPYFVGTQPLLHGFDQGARLRVDAWHATLAALEPSVGHMALAVDGLVIWERQVAIPGDAEAYSDLFDAPSRALEGDSVVLHIHNHGTNTWNFHALTQETP